MATDKQTVLSAAIQTHLTRVMPDVISTIIHDFIRPDPQQAHRDKMSDVLEVLAHFSEAADGLRRWYDGGRYVPRVTQGFNYEEEEDSDSDSDSDSDEEGEDSDDEYEPVCEEDESLRTVYGDEHIFNVSTVSACMLIMMRQSF